VEAERQGDLELVSIVAATVGAYNAVEVAVDLAVDITVVVTSREAVVALIGFHVGQCGGLGKKKQEQEGRGGLHPLPRG